MSKLITDVYKQTKQNRPPSRNVKGNEVLTDTTIKPQQQAAPAKSDDEVLRDFDLSLEFGPCIGVSRLERWERAQKHGLKPPTQVKEILMRHSDNPEYTECVWNDYNI